MDAETQKELEQTVEITMSAAVKVTGMLINELMTPAMARKVAVYQREYYNNLIEQGFTKTQAMALVSTTGLNGFMNSLKK